MSRVEGPSRRGMPLGKWEDRVKEYVSERGVRENGLERARREGVDRERWGSFLKSRTEGIKGKGWGGCRREGELGRRQIKG